MRGLAIAAGIATLAGIGYVATRDTKKKRKKTSSSVPTPTPTPTPTPKPRPTPSPGGGGGNWVGNGWTNWPEQHIFPDETSFAQALMLLGYDIGPADMSGWPDHRFLWERSLVQEAVKAFQRQYNSVVRYLKAEGLATSDDREIGVDGKIGSQTTTALASVLYGLQESQGVDCTPNSWNKGPTCGDAWAQIVAEAVA